MLISFKRSQASIVLRVKIFDSSVTTGAGLTGLTSASTGLIISTIADNESSATAYTVAGSTIESITALGTFAAPTATKVRFKEVDSTNHKGVYELQIANARFAVSSAKSLLVSISGATNAAQCDALVPLVDLDPYANPTLATAVTADGKTLRTAERDENHNNVKWVAPASATPAGSNANAGTRAAPVLTVAYAASIAVAGDRIVVTPGTYPESPTIPADVDLYLMAGANLATTVTSGPAAGLTLGARCRLDGAGTITLTTSGTAGATMYGVDCTGPNARVDNVNFVVDNTGGDNSETFVMVRAAGSGTALVGGLRMALTGVLSSNAATSGSVRIAGPIDLNGTVTQPTGNAVQLAGATVAATSTVTFANGTVSTLTAALVWNYLTSAATTAGSLGKLLVDNVNATISSRSTLTAANVWDYLTSAATTAGSIGKWILDKLDVVLSTRGTSTVTATQVKAQADQALVDVGLTTTVTGRIDAAVSSRMATFSYTAPDNATIASINAKTTNLPASPAAVGSAMTLTSAYDAAKTAASQTSVDAARTHIDNIETAVSLVSTDLANVAADTAAMKGTGFTTGDDLHSIKAASGGEGTALSDEQAAQLLGAYTNTGLLALGVRQIVTYTQTSSIGIIQGDSYLNADSRPILVYKAANAPWPTDLTGWTITAEITPAAGTLANAPTAAPLSITGTVVTATGSNQAVRWDMTAVQTAALVVGANGGASAYRYDVRASSGTKRVTLEIGYLNVTEDAA